LGRQLAWLGCDPSPPVHLLQLDAELLFGLGPWKVDRGSDLVGDSPSFRSFLGKVTQSLTLRFRSGTMALRLPRHPGDRSIRSDGAMRVTYALAQDYLWGRSSAEDLDDISKAVAAHIMVLLDTG
jgi:hypothetical protein